ncbi:MAG: class I SAM-dependent methyltransferase [Methylocella sp.]|jgi:SAM-dependent methyltransferase
MKVKTPDLRISSYDDVAAEYYDLRRHPTCANFSQLSSAFLVPRILGHELRGANILEVGAGRSTVAPIMQERGLPMPRLTLLDQSSQMLAHSQEWERKGARLLVGNAWRTELPAASFELVVAALGDPYNCVIFWHEVARLLEWGGVCLFTTPAPEWATRFRRPDSQSHAEFVIADGTTVLVPSNIPSLDQQIRMITDSGLHVIEVGCLSGEQLSGVHSPKLLVDKTTKQLPIVRGFVARRI